MTFPVWIRLGPWVFHPHAVLEVVGYLAAALAFLVLRPRAGDVLTAQQRTMIVGAALLGSSIGSRALAWPGGKTAVGGVLGGFLLVEIVKRWRGITVRTGDLFVIPACLGMAIGRVGCFLTGLSDGTYGIATRWPTGVDFGDGVLRHPTQLYEVAFLAAFGALLWAVRERVVVRGDLFRLFVAGYLTWRLVVDIIKPEPRLAFGLSVIQWAAVAGLVWVGRDLRRIATTLRPRRAALSPRGQERDA